MRIGQILHDKVHWVFEAEGMPNWPPDSEEKPITLVDITDKPEVQEGWGYVDETGEFIEPVYEGIEIEVDVESISTEELTNYILEVDYRVVILEMGL